MLGAPRERNNVRIATERPKRSQSAQSIGERRKVRRIHDDDVVNNGGASSSGINREPVLPFADEDDDVTIEYEDHNSRNDTIEDESADSEETIWYPEDSEYLLAVGKSRLLAKERLDALAITAACDNTATTLQPPDCEHGNDWIMPQFLSTDAATTCIAESFNSARYGSMDGDRGIELGIGHNLRHWVYPDGGNRVKCRQNEVYVVQYHNVGTPEVVVEREMNVLTLQEARSEEPKVRQAIRDELKRWIDLGGVERMDKSKATNVLDSRWVLKWKIIDGVREIKARLTARGYKDMQANDVNTYAGTATRYGQRFV